MPRKPIPQPPSRPTLGSKRFAAPALPKKAVTGPGLPSDAARSKGLPPSAAPSKGLPRSASPNALIPANATSGQPGMIGAPAAGGSLHGGSQKLSPKSMKGSAMLGRNDNLKSKMEFKTGSNCEE
jgi:hypothetical protein